MLPRFLAASVDVATGLARLDADETRHLTQVLRLGVGDGVGIFDGAGREFRAVVQRVTREGAELRVIEEVAAALEPAVRITLAQAVLKGDKMDDVVRDATMMGAAVIVPLITEHTVAHVKRGAAPDRWRRIAIASAKQCRRAVVPRIDAACTLTEWLAADRAEQRLILLEPAADRADHAKRAAAEYTQSPPASASLLVGPEGGWSRGEVDAAVQAGCRALTLGRRTLRADAVAVIAIGILQHTWGDL